MQQVLSMIKVTTRDQSSMQSFGVWGLVEEDFIGTKKQTNGLIQKIS